MTDLSPAEQAVAEALLAHANSRRSIQLGLDRRVELHEVAAQARDAVAAAEPVLRAQWRREHPCAEGCALEREAGQITDEQLKVWEREVLDDQPPTGAVPLLPEQPDGTHAGADRG